jgi:hypothetical protein
MLPPEPYNFPDGFRLEKYVDKTTHFTQDVIETWGKNTMKVGTIDFDYNIWTGLTSRDRKTGAAALVGKFTFDGSGMVALKPGLRMGWVQTIRATVSGDNEWDAPNDTQYPDTKNMQTNPDYKFEELFQANAPPKILTQP